MRAPYLVLFAAVLAACHSSTDPGVDTSLKPTSTNVAGAFNLVSANGTAPPFAAFLTATADWTLQADTIAIAATNTWTETTTYFVTSLIDNTTATQFTVVGGTYAIANGQINFTMTQGGSTVFPGSVSGDTLTIIFSGKRFLYVRGATAAVAAGTAP